MGHLTRFLRHPLRAIRRRGTHEPSDRSGSWSNFLADEIRALTNDERSFLRFCLDNVGETHAQILQDLWVLFECGSARDGYFVEFGATDGKSLSNTYLLEKSFGWRGLLAEPNPLWHAALRQNRSAAISDLCVSATGGENVEFLVPAKPELSTLASSAPDERHPKFRKKAKSIQVNTVTLIDLLRGFKAPTTIDYMSIDTEGSELSILGAFDFGRYDVKLFSVEHNHTNAEREIDLLMERNGYQRRFRNLSAWDAWYRKRPPSGLAA
ncbi:MAG: FkbM family methyltransferase [Bauldia sp.]